MFTGFHARVLVVRVEEFTLDLVHVVLKGANFQVEAVKTATDVSGQTDLKFVVATQPYGVNR